jgi:hypothetical protein
MRDFLGPVNAAQVQTELGLIYVLPSGRMGIQVHAPPLTVDGVPLEASADLSSNGEPLRFDLVRTWDSKEGRFFTGQSALRARLVDGRDADLVTLGKIAQVIVPAVRKFAEENQGLNPWNKVVQDHRDGTIHHDLTNDARAQRGLPVPWTPKMGDTEAHQPPVS